jgi:hypothetical protein
VSDQKFASVFPTAVSSFGATARDLFYIVRSCTSDLQLDEVARLLWSAYGQKRVDDTEATFLGDCIEARRPHRRSVARGVGTFAGRVSIFPARRYQASPDREGSRSRRRTLGGSSALPDGRRRHYTEGQRSVLYVVANEVKRQGVCDLVDEI